MRATDLDDLREILRVRTGATCLDPDALARDVEPWLYDESLPADVTVEVEGSRDNPRRASFRVVRSGHTIAHRAFDPGPPRCDHLHAALGLAIALSLKATLLEDLGRPLPDDPQARADAWALTAAGLAAYQVLPDTALGFELRGELPLTRSFMVRAGGLALRSTGVDLVRAPGEFDATQALHRSSMTVPQYPLGWMPGSRSILQTMLNGLPFISLRSA